MINKILFFLVWLAYILSASPVMAAGGGWYVAMDVGEATYKESDFYKPTGWSTKIENHVSGYRLLVIYRFDPYWGLEAGYAKFGQAAADSRNTGALIPDKGTYFNAQVHANGWQVDGTAGYPFATYWTVFARFGLIDATLNYFDQTDGFVYPALPVSDSSWEKTYGIGISRAIGSRLDLRLGWDNYLELGGEASTGGNSVSMVSLGLQYAF